MLPADTPLPVPRRRVGKTSAVYGESIAMTPPVAVYSSASIEIIARRLLVADGAIQASPTAHAIEARAKTIMLRRLLHIP